MPTSITEIATTHFSFYMILKTITRFSGDQAISIKKVNGEKLLYTTKKLKIEFFLHNLVLHF